MNQLISVSDIQPKLQPAYVKKRGGKLEYSLHVVHINSAEFGYHLMAAKVKTSIQNTLFGLEFFIFDRKP